LATKSLLLGFDGLDHRFLDNLIEEGVAPNFKALRDRSRRADLGVYPGMGAGAFWASGATGVTPDYHGRYFFLQFDPKTYDIYLFHEATTLRAAAFWETLDEQGQKCAVIDWHRAPFKQLRYGMLIDNWLSHDAPSPLKSSPPQKAAEILDTYGHDPLAGGFATRNFDSPEESLVYARDAVKRIAYKVKFCIDQLKEHEWAVFTTCFSEPHDLGHYFLQLSHPNHALFDEATHNKFGDPMRECYLALDKALAPLCETAGPDAAIMVFAGPGMEPMVSANAAMDEITLRLDLGPAAPVTNTQIVRNSYRSFIPHALRIKLAPLARKARQLFVDDAYKKRRFFAVPHNDNSGCIRLNVKGREKYGIISPGAEFDAVAAEIRDGLLSLKNPETGARAVANVYFRKGAYDGPYADALPDIFAVWNRVDNNRNFTQLTSERTGVINVPPNLRTGDHTNTGFFWSTGGDAPVFNKKGRRMPHEITDAIVASAQ